MAVVEFPTFRPPQLATLADKVPAGSGWLFEMKYDGYRCQAAIAGNKVRLYSRGGFDWTRQFGYVAPALAGISNGTMLIDGEICALDPEGRSNFTLLKASLDGKRPIVFFAFDLLEQGGEPVWKLPQIERKERLAAALAHLPEMSPVLYSPHVEDRGDQVFKAMCDGGFEGLIAKRTSAIYHFGDRSPDWIKVKCTKRQQFIVIGWRPPDYGPDDVRGLYLASEEEGALVYRGSVGTGFTDKMRREVRDALALIPGGPLEVVGMPRGEARVIRWVEPRLVADVAYTEIAADGGMRHPSFKGIRVRSDA